jgi:hypothetical protein
MHPSERPRGGRIKRGARQSRYDTRIGPRTGRGFQATVQNSPLESRIGSKRRGGKREGSRLKSVVPHTPTTKSERPAQPRLHISRHFTTHAAGAHFLLGGFHVTDRDLRRCSATSVEGDGGIQSCSVQVLGRGPAAEPELFRQSAH